MMNKTSMLIVCGWLVCGVAWTKAQAAEDSAHNELRALRTEVIEAITKGELERLLTRVHTNVVVTWQNGEVCRGHQGLRDFFNRMGQHTFKGYKLPPTPDELTILHAGDTGVSFGKTVAQYKLLGKEIEMTSRWTATVVKEDGRWLLASYHISGNLLDNPLLNAAKGGLFWGVGLGAVAGLVLGLLLGKRKRH
jgi:ketosteroid isomerase-like protein